MTVYRKTRVLSILFLVVGIVLILNYVVGANSNGSGSPGGVGANLQLWLKANAGTSTTTNGANVTGWIDQSPNGWTAANQVENVPTYHVNAMNFNPAVTFGTLGRTELSIGAGYPQSPVGSGGLTIFTAFDPGLDTDTLNFIVDVGRAKGDGYGVAASAGTYFSYNSTTNTGGFGTGEGLTTGSVFGETPALLTHRVQFGVGSTLYANGAPLTSTVNLVLNRLDNNNINFSPSHQLTSGPVTIGRQAKNGHIDTGGGRYFRGDIAEVIIYNANITGTDKVKIESYLAVKYGITLTDTVDYLASDGTIVYPSTASHSGYTNDIAGVAVDTSSALIQTTSRSINPDSIVTITGTLAAMSSGEYLVWGNDDGALTPSSEVPPTSPSGRRLTREWRVAETGEVGTVTVSFDLSAVAGDIDFSNPAGFALLIDGDGDFSDATVTTGAAVNGQVVTFNGVDFSNGDYYTLAFPTDMIEGLTAVNDGPTLLGNTTNLTATVINGTNVSFTWDLGDGNNAAGATVSHIYPAEGTYTAVVTASNSVNVLTATTTVIIVGPKSTPTSTPTQTPLPTATPTSTSTAAPTSTPSPSPTLSPSPTATPTSKPPAQMYYWYIPVVYQYPLF